MADEIELPEAPDTPETPTTVAPSEPMSTRDAVERAFAADDTVEEATEDGNAAPERDERGRFVAKNAEATEKPADDQAPAREKPRWDAPAGLDGAAKAAWDAAPDELKGAVSRRFRDMEEGLAGYQREYGGLREFAEEARRAGTTLRDVVAGYREVENQLYADPKAGFKALAQRLGFDLSTLAGPAEVDQTARELAEVKRELAALKQGRQADHQAALDRETQGHIAAFANATNPDGTPRHPRFEELRLTMAALIQTQTASSMEDAYDMARAIADRNAPPPTMQAAQTRTPTSRGIAGAPAMR